MRAALWLARLAGLLVMGLGRAGGVRDPGQRGRRGLGWGPGVVKRDPGWLERGRRTGEQLAGLGEKVERDC